MSEIVVRIIDCHVVAKFEGEWKFLILKRSPSKRYPKIWQCVTGKIENDEHPWQTAIREVKEETGLELTGLVTVDQVNQYYDAKWDQMNLIPVFGMTVKETDVKLSDEHTEFKWCSIDEACPLFCWNQQRSGAIIFHDMLTNSIDKLEISRII